LWDGVRNLSYDLRLRRGYEARAAWASRQVVKPERQVSGTEVPALQNRVAVRPGSSFHQGMSVNYGELTYDKVFIHTLRYSHDKYYSMSVA